MIDNSMLRRLAVELEAAHYGERLFILKRWLTANGIPSGRVFIEPPAATPIARFIAKQIDAEIRKMSQPPSSEWIHSQMKPKADVVGECNKRIRKWYWQIAWDVLDIFHYLAVSVFVVGVVFGWWWVVFE